MQLNYNLSNLNLTKQQQESLSEKFKYAINGIVLVVGKSQENLSVASRCILNEIGKINPHKRIIAVMKRMDYDLSVSPQIELFPGETYADRFDGLMKSNADIIFIEEMDTKEVIEKVFETPHLLSPVISSFHARSVFDAISKLSGMGISGYNISMLRIVITQAVLGKPCNKCTKVADWSEEKNHDLKILIKKLNLQNHGFTCSNGKNAKNNTCENCQGTGYKGSIEVFEVLNLNEKCRDLIQKKATIDQLREQFYPEGFKSMWEIGLEKVLAGETTLAQLVDVLDLSTMPL